MLYCIHFTRYENKSWHSCVQETHCRKGICGGEGGEEWSITDKRIKEEQTLMCVSKYATSDK